MQSPIPPSRQPPSFRHSRPRGAVIADMRAKATTSLRATSHNNASHLPLPTTHQQQSFRNCNFADPHLQEPASPHDHQSQGRTRDVHCWHRLPTASLTPAKADFRATINTSSSLCPATTPKYSRTFSLRPNVLPSLTQINRSATPLGSFDARLLRE